MEINQPAALLAATGAAAILTLGLASGPASASTITPSGQAHRPLATSSKAISPHNPNAHQVFWWTPWSGILNYMGPCAPFCATKPIYA